MRLLVFAECQLDQSSLRLEGSSEPAPIRISTRHEDYPIQKVPSQLHYDVLLPLHVSPSHIHEMHNYLGEPSVKL